ncbi:MAG: TIGR02206 family membrane protein [Candidatus Latescibacterota bacterium]|nr:TIGR02206 family membrane protein [Candidatus Latescibacterota bacterium]
MELFSGCHLFWLGVTAVFVAGCVQAHRLSARGHARFRAAFFSVVLVNELAWFCYRHFVAGIPLVGNLPLHLCDISVFTLLAGLVTGRRLFVEWAYYPGVVGALLAVCFPAISESGAIRVVAEIRYFLTHVALVGAGFYFTFGCGYRPSTLANLRSYLAIHVYAMAITPVNLLLGTNYFFTLSAPKALAFAHAYPHWLFLAAVSLIFLCVFSLMHLPFVRRRDG